MRMVEKSQGPTLASDSAGLASDVAFAELWDVYRRLKAGAAGNESVLGKVDPVVFLMRRRILEDCLKGLLARSAPLRSLSMDQKKLLAKRLSNTVWKGYLLALAHNEISGETLPTRAMMDYTYLWGVFSNLMKACEPSFASAAPLEPAVARSLAEVQSRDTEKLQEALGAVGAGSVVGSQGEEKLLFAAVGGLVLMGFMIWRAQRKALGAE
jgi:hypothetical protein